MDAAASPKAAYLCILAKRPRPKHTPYQLKRPLAQKYSYSPKSYNAFEEHGQLSMLNSGLGWNTIANVIAINCHLVKQTSHWRNNLMFAYRLSVFGSVAPPGNGLGRGGPTRERGQ